MRKLSVYVGCAALVIGLIGGAAGLGQAWAQADAPAVCPYFAQVESARTTCGDVNGGQLCLNAGQVEIDGAAFGLADAVRSLDGITRVSGDVDSLATFRPGATGDADAPTVTLFGAVEIVNMFTGDADAPRAQVTVTNNGQFILNLRAESNANSTVITTLARGASLQADGRSNDGEWLHIVLDDGREAWVNASVISVEGEIGALTVVDDPIQHPMQRFTLATADECGGALMQADTGAVEINGARVALDEATVFARTDDEMLTLRVISGEVNVQTAGTLVNAGAGAEVRVSLTDDVAGAPERADRYAFAALTHVPLDLLASESLVCVAGVIDEDAPVYRGPGETYALARAIDSATHLNVTGRATTDDGATWYLVDGVNWVAETAVLTYGTCGSVREVAAQVIQQPVPNVSQPGQDSVTIAHNLLPAGQSIWQAFTGPDTLVGTCNAPPIAACDFPSAVITNPNGSIQWRGQEPMPFTMSPTGADAFAYRGRNGLNNANVTFTMYFTSEATWAGVMQIVYDNDPACTHTFNYTANRIR